MAACTPRYSLRALARLLSYPDPVLIGQLPALRQVFHQDPQLAGAERQALDVLIDGLTARDLLEVQAEYVELFDRGRATSLNLFEHVHGDSRDRGQAMVDLLATYEHKGLRLDATATHGELPDHLPVVLEFVSVLPPDEFEGFMTEIAHILNALRTALVKRGSPYAGVVGAALQLGQQAIEMVDAAEEPALDVAWSEPEAFGGCTREGQALPGDPQPIHIVRPARNVSQRGAQP